MTITQLYSIIGILFTLLVSVLGFLAKLVFELNNSVTELKTLEPDRKLKAQITDARIYKIEQTIQDHEIRFVKLEGKKD